MFADFSHLVISDGAFARFARCVSDDILDIWTRTLKVIVFNDIITAHLFGVVFSTSSKTFHGSVAVDVYLTRCDPCNIAERIITY